MSRGEAALLELCGAIKDELGLAGKAFRELRDTSVIESTTLVFNAAGLISRDYPVPYAAVAIYSLSAQKVTAANLPPASGAPAQGQGTAQVGPLGFGIFNMAGRSLTLYGNPGDAVTFTVFAKPQAPNAASGQVAIATTAAADGVAPGSVGLIVPGVFNGTTVDRLRGSNGAINTLTQAAFPVYTEAAVVNGARLASGNIAGGSIPNNASLFLVSVNVSVFTGGTNLTYSLQVQDANGNWLTVGSTALITATGVYGFSVGPGMTNGNALPSGAGNWRVSWVANGAFTAVTSQIGVTGR